MRPSSRLRRVVAAVVVALLAVAGCTTSGVDEPPPGQVPPNIVFVMMDDLDAKAFPYMSAVRELVGDRGATLQNMIYSQPLCCPSRVAMLRGQYGHSSGVQANEPPDGGYGVFYDAGLESSTVATWLQDAGYTTAHLGKYLNGYPAYADLPDTHVPAGWDRWFVLSAESGGPPDEYTVNDDGVIVPYGLDDHITDVLAAESVEFLESDLAESPFYLEITPRTPHVPTFPEARHADLFADVRYPRDPSFNERSVIDKPSFLADQPRLTRSQVARIDHVFRQRIRGLQAVDELVERLVETLEAQGELDNTHLFVGSDNGIHMGEHRLPVGKNLPYETDVVVPMYVRGPGVTAGSSVDQLVGNLDLPVTFADLAGAETPDFVEGRSLVPLLSGEDPPWRNVFLLERGGGRPFVGLRTATSTYVEWPEGEGEYYRLDRDPYQLRNAYDTMPPTLRSALSDLLADLAACTGAECRTVEDRPLPTGA